MRTLALVALLLAGCSSGYVITDRSRIQTQLSNPELTKRTNFIVLHGGVAKKIPISQIRLLTIYSDESISRNKMLFYRCVVELRDGTIIAKSTDVSGPVANAYVAVDDHLRGTTATGPVEAPLDNVYQLQRK